MKTSSPLYSYTNHEPRELPEWVTPVAWGSAFILGTVGLGIHLRTAATNSVLEYSASIETRAATPPRYLAATTADQALVDVVGATVHRLEVL